MWLKHVDLGNVKCNILHYRSFYALIVIHPTCSHEFGLLIGNGVVPTSEGGLCADVVEMFACRLVNVFIVAPESLPTLVDGSLKQARAEAVR
jgi:hypothetical protein